MAEFAISVHPMAENKVVDKQKISTTVRATTQGRSMLLPGFFLLLVLSILFYVWTRVEVVQLGYEISSALEEKEAVGLVHNELKLENATLRSAQHVERRVRETLGMDFPHKDQIIMIR